MYSIDTETLYSMAYSRVIQEYGKKYTWEHKAKIMGLISLEGLHTLISMLHLPITAETFESKLFPIYEEIFPQCNLMPGELKQSGNNLVLYLN